MIGRRASSTLRTRMRADGTAQERKARLGALDSVRLARSNRVILIGTNKHIFFGTKRAGRSMEGSGSAPEIPVRFRARAYAGVMQGWQPEDKRGLGPAEGLLRFLFLRSFPINPKPQPNVQIVRHIETFK